MSTVLGNMKFRVDENESEKYNNIKKVGGGENEKTDVPKRAALGDIQNRTNLRAGVGKDGAKDFKDVKLPATRTVKPRVDTYRKKSNLVSNGTNASGPATTTTSIATTKTLRAAVAPAAKVLTRSHSQRITTATTTNATATTTTVGGIQRQVSATAHSKEIKTLTTKLVENKLQQVKLIKKDKILAGETKLRREDSNLSRKSLTKLKAALVAREGKTINAKIQSIEAGSKVQHHSKSHENDSVPQLEEIKKTDEKVSQSDNIICQTEATGFRIVSVVSHSTALLNGVRNIDEGDDESLALVSDYVNEIYEYLFKLEIEQPINKNHLSNQIAVTPKMRSILLDWINEVHSQFRLVTETFHMTVGIIDRYLQLVNDTKRTQLQLVGVTALFIAAKYEELYPPAMSDYIYMTDHSYTQKQIIEMEMQILRIIDCNLSRPIPIHFLRRFSKATDITDEEHSMSKYFLELAAIEYDLASYKPSEIAAASLFLSLHMGNGNSKKATGFIDSHWDSTLEYYSTYTATHLRPITRKIAKLARYAPEAKLNAVYTKYQSTKLHKASMRPELYSPLMDSIINSEG